MIEQYSSVTIGISFSHARGIVSRAHFPICFTSSSEKILTISLLMASGVASAVNPFTFFRIAPAALDHSVARVGTPSTAASLRTSGALSNTEGKNSMSAFR